MIRGVASYIVMFAFDYSTGAPKTGDAAKLTAYVEKDFGGANILGGSPNAAASELSAVNQPGWYKFAVTAPEADAHALLFTGRSNTANVAVVGQFIYTVEYNAVADALLDRDMSAGADVGSGSPSYRTVRQALRHIRNKWTISGTTLTVYKEDDTTVAWTAQISATPGADPITGSDPS